jgi:hypothetical protein
MSLFAAVSSEQFAHRFVCPPSKVIGLQLAFENASCLLPSHLSTAGDNADLAWARQPNIKHVRKHPFQRNVECQPLRANMPSSIFEEQP